MRGREVTANKIQDAMERRGLPTVGVDFAKVAAVQNDDARRVSGWEAPPPPSQDWRELDRDVDGARYLSAGRRLMVILSCSIEADGRAWLHLSVSSRAISPRLPTHGEMVLCKEAFLGDRYAYAVLPPRRMYVNINEVLHYFALLDEGTAQPLPDFTGGTGSI